MIDQRTRALADEQAAKMKRDGRCPLHREAGSCPTTCDYWERSRAIEAKALTGICCVTDCVARAMSGTQVCAGHMPTGEDLEDWRRRAYIFSPAATFQIEIIDADGKRKLI